MGTLNLSDEERERRSKAMKLSNAQGKTGAEYGKLGGRPRKKRANEVAADKIREKGEMIANKLLNHIENGDPKISLEAIKHAHFIDESERKIEIEEEVRYEQLKHAELAELLIGNLRELIARGDIGAEIIDAEIIAEREVVAISQSNGSNEEKAEDGRTHDG